MNSFILLLVLTICQSLLLTHGSLFPSPTGSTGQTHSQLETPEIGPALQSSLKLVYAGVTCVCSDSSSPVCYSHWQSIGPFHVSQAYTGIGNGLNDPEDIGAIHAIWTNGADVAYVGSVNGGVWRTTTLHSAVAYGGPHWVPLTDQMPCMSISTLSGSTADNNVVAAGCGFPSNSADRGGEPKGVMVTTDGGTSWKMSAFPVGYWVSSILVSGIGSTAQLIVAAQQSILVSSGSTGSSVDPYGVGSSVGGIWKSTDAGTTFTKTHTSPISKLAFHPTTGTTIYGTLLASQSSTSWPATVIVSTDSGTTWSYTSSNPSITSVCDAATYTSMVNSKVTLTASRLFVGYYLEDSSSNNCYALFHSTSSGSSWTAITNVPTADLGTQGKNNFAFLADPTSTTNVFIAGTGRAVFRVDVTTNIWTLLSSVGPDGTTISVSYQTTKSSTAPHSDARTFFWDSSSNDLLLTNDGGICKRTNPASSPELGDWTTLSGDLTIPEIYQAAYDPKSGAILIGVQDNSLMISQFDGTEAASGRWNFYETADGTTVGYDHSTNSFYGAIQSLGSWFKFPVAKGGLSSAVTFTQSFSSSCSAGGDCFGFITVQAVNSVDPTKILVCTAYDTSDSSNPYTASTCYSATFTKTTQSVTALEFTTSILAADDAAGAYVYGGRRNGVANVNVAFVVGSTFIWARDTVCATSSCITQYSGSCSSSSGCKIGNSLNSSPPWKNYVSLVLMAQHPTNYYINLVTDDAGHTWLTTDFGQSWTDLNLVANSNLLSISGHTTVDTFNTGAVAILNVTINGVYPIVIGLPYGTFVSFNAPSSSYFTFIQLGANLAKTIPTSYIYAPSTDTLVVSLFGRGMWQLLQVTSILTSAANGVNTTAINPACKTPLYPNVANAYGYRSDGVTPSPIGFGIANLPISLPYPLIHFNLLGTIPSLPGGNISAFAQQLQSDLAVECGVSSMRIILMAFTPLSSSTILQIQFTISDLWSGSSSSELSTEPAARQFLTRISDNTTTLYSRSKTLRYTIYNSVAFSSTVVTSLVRNSFALTYSLDALPGGSPAAFGLSLIKDLAVTTQVEERRVVINSLSAGSVIVIFTISPAISASEVSSATASSTFSSALLNTSSILYSGAVTNAAISTSGGIGLSSSSSTGGVGEPDSSSDNNFFTTLNLGLIIGGAVFVLIAIGCVCCYAHRKSTDRHLHGSVQPGDKRPAIELSAPEAFTSVALHMPPHQQQQQQQVVYSHHQPMQYSQQPQQYQPVVYAHPSAASGPSRQQQYLNQPQRKVGPHPTIAAAPRILSNPSRRPTQVEEGRTYQPIQSNGP